MKKVIAPPSPEKAEYYSDFSGKKFRSTGPEVSLSLEFNYGSRYDGSALKFDLFDRESAEILSLIAERLCGKSRKQLKKLLGSARLAYEENLDSRDWEGCERTHAHSELLESLLEEEKPRPARTSQG